MERLIQQWRGPLSPLAAFIWEAQRALRTLTRRFGVWGWSMFTLIVLSAAAGAVAWQQHVQALELATRLTEYKRKAPLPALALRTPEPSDNPARLVAFEAHLLPHEDIALLVQNVLRVAEDEGLAVKRGDYRTEIDNGGGFLRYRMNLPVRGKPTAVHRFIQNALYTQKSLALESVQFKRERIDAAELEARIQWVAITQLPARLPTQLPAQSATQPVRALPAQPKPSHIVRAPEDLP